VHGCISSISLVLVVGFFLVSQDFDAESSDDAILILHNVCVNPNLFDDWPIFSLF
jgi:hypothetical protein